MQLTIGQLAKKAGINVETVRYYERRGLIRRPRKPDSGYRKYDAAILQQLQFIRRAKRIGFKLDEIESLLLLSDSPCEDIQSLAQLKLEQVRTRLNDLQRLEAVLEQLIRQCSQRPNKTHCPIIQSLLQDSQ
jgi:MerR family mercuric resistance operon transcriptional regulator